MKQITLNEVASLLKEHDNFKILTHSYPDGDCLGSGYALAFILRKLGKKANVAVDGALPSKFAYLVKNYAEQEFVPQYIVSVDVAAPTLLGESVMQGVERIDLCIDHHGTNSLEAEYRYVDDTAAAAAEIIFQLIGLLGVELDEDIAGGIYTGISTDTGCFVYTNTTPQTHRIAAAVMPFCDWRMINSINFVIKSRAKLKMERMIYKTMEFYAGGKVAIVYTTLAMCEAMGTGDDEMEGLANIPRRIEGVEMGITMREKAGGVFKISVRTNDNVDASRFCQQFGGGGHPAASGCSIEGDLETVKRKLIDAAEEYLR
ncbi:MAG: bifunctional oligoribonuclease/PAP phosphatase NrnA [Ruminococcus sp.]|nr:bifunctional oligoribonuclease/PAP phosphatase NrnA [Ruminococcus sp.]